MEREPILAVRMDATEPTIPHTHPSNADTDIESLVQTLEAALEETLELQFTDLEAAARRAEEVSSRAAAAAMESDHVTALGACARALRALFAEELEVVPIEAQRALDGIPLGSARFRGLSLQLLGRAAEARGNVDEASGYYDQGLREARQAGTLHGQGVFLTFLSSVETLRGDFEAASSHALEARAIHRREGNRSAEEKALHAQGIILLLRGAVIEAVAVLQEAADLCRALGQDRILGGRLAATSHAQRMAGQAEEALVSATEAEALLRREDDREGLASALGALSQARLALGDVPGAISTASAHLELARQLDRPLLMADGCAFLAAASLAANLLRKAEHLAREGLVFAESSKDNWAAHECLLVAGQVALREDRFEEGIDLLEASRTRLAPDDRRRHAHVQGLLAKLYEQQGDLAAAVHALQVQNELLEEASSAEAGVRLHHIRAVHRLERAEAAAAETERGISRALLEAQDQERRHVARELHDDLSQRLALLVVQLEALEGGSRSPPRSCVNESRGSSSRFGRRPLRCTASRDVSIRLRSRGSDSSRPRGPFSRNSRRATASGSSSHLGAWTGGSDPRSNSASSA